MTGNRITSVSGWEALDSRGRPTVACRVVLGSDATASVVVPSGASTGAHEAHELRDGGTRYGGQGVRRAVDNLNDVLGPAVTGLDAADQRAVDERLRETDGTADLSTLGANAVLAVSLAVFSAASPAVRRPARSPLPLPMPMFNILSGGAHAQRAMDIQDVLVIPIGAPTFADAVEWGWRVRQATAAAAAAAGLSTALVADEGGFGPPLKANRQGLDLVADGIERAGLEPGRDAAIAIDLAASQFEHSGRYLLGTEGRTLDRDGWLDEIAGWLRAYPIVSVEDPFGDDDWAAWAALTRLAGDGVQIVGDDLFATNTARVTRGLEEGAANAVLVKPNQIGTVTSAADLVALAHRNGMRTVVSARSGDTEDAWLADMAVGWGASQIKVGSLARSERTAKWNRLLELDADPRIATVLRPWEPPTGREPAS